MTPQNEEIPDIFDDVEVEFEPPANIDNEFKPFIRRMPEFQFWVTFIKAVVFSFVASFFWIFNLPANVVILIVYFIIISMMTVSKLLKHMKKYNYNPFFESKTHFKVSK